MNPPNDIQELDGAQRVEPVTAGWSADRKYRVTSAAGAEWLLRVADAADFARKKLEYDEVARVAGLGIPCPRPVAFGLCAGGTRTYSLFTWVEGSDAREIVPALAPAAQYQLGCEAGRLLRRMHALAPVDETEAWSTRFNRKIDRKIELYRKCPVHIPGAEAFLRYIEKRRPLLDGRPQTFQHGDYHIGNLLVMSNGHPGVIDFNRLDHGDPWEEFNRIVWCVEASPPFASGRVDGYFDGEPPEAFFPLLALYISSNSLSSIPWALSFGAAEVATMRKQLDAVLADYDGMTRLRPRWYAKPPRSPVDSDS